MNENEMRNSVAAAIVIHSLSLSDWNYFSSYENANKLMWEKLIKKYAFCLYSSFAACNQNP